MADLLTAAACDFDDVQYHSEARLGLFVDGFGDGIRLLQQRESAAPTLPTL
jgi:hypothetical protein